MCWSGYLHVPTVHMYPISPIWILIRSGRKRYRIELPDSLSYLPGNYVSAIARQWQNSELQLAHGGTSLPTDAGTATHWPWDYARGRLRIQI